MRNTNLRTSSIILIFLFLIITTVDAVADRKRDQKQAKLDAACEQVREKQLAPMRAQFVEECVQNKEQADRKACETFYADFGAQSGRRAPLFYDLPECVEAFEYQNSQRQR
jgi:hypothetical protein